jgi:hypothetical protein
MVPRRRPLIRQKRRQCSRMGSTSQGERGVVSGTATVAVESTQRGDGGAVPAAIKKMPPNSRKRGDGGAVPAAIKKAQGRPFERPCKSG